MADMGSSDAAHAGMFDWIMGRIYDRQMAGAEDACLRQWRSELLTSLAGDVVEIGAGTGLNLPHYGPHVADLVLCEPSAHMRRGLHPRVVDAAPKQVEILGCEAENLPFDDGQFDHVVGTLVLCTVRDPDAAVAEVFRVLKPGGTFVYLEHVGSDEPGRLAWQRRLEPLWKVVACGCHLTRDTDATLRRAGFQLPNQTRESMRKAFAIVRPTIRGVAIKPDPATLTP